MKLLCVFNVCGLRGNPPPVFDEPLDTTGVYLIINVRSGKVYVGSAAQSIRKRCGDHRSALRRGEHKNIHIQRSWNKNGEDRFVFVVAEYCSPEDCVRREQYWMDKLRGKGVVLFNRVPFAGSVRGLRHSEETKERLRQIAQKQFADPEVRKKHGAIGKGRKQSEEEKCKRGESIRAFWQSHPEKHVRWDEENRKRIGNQHRGLKHSEESLEKMRQSQRRIRKDPQYRQRQREWLRKAHLGKKRPPEWVKSLRRGAVLRVLKRLAFITGNDIL